MKETIESKIKPDTTLLDVIHHDILPSELLLQIRRLGIGPADSWGAVIDALRNAAGGGGGPAPIGGRPAPTRAGGGDVWPGLFKVAERGPEMLTMGGNHYLISPGAGYVTPLVAAPKSEGGRGGGGNTYQTTIQIYAQSLDDINKGLAREGLPPLQEIAKGARA
jgi:hypothetical protein